MDWNVTACMSYAWIVYSVSVYIVSVSVTVRWMKLTLLAFQIQHMCLVSLVFNWPPPSLALSLSLHISVSFSVYVRMFSSILFLILLSSLSSLVFGFSCRLFTLDSNGRKVWLCWQRFEHMRVSATQENEFIWEKSTWERILLFGCSVG